MGATVSESSTWPCEFRDRQPTLRSRRCTGHTEVGENVAPESMPVGTESLEFWRLRVEQNASHGMRSFPWTMSPDGPCLCPEGTSDNSPPISSVGHRAKHFRSPEGRQSRRWSCSISIVKLVWESLLENLSSLAGLRVSVGRHSHRLKRWIIARRPWRDEIPLA
jgi:hypothetical protein